MTCCGGCGRDTRDVLRRVVFAPKTEADLAVIYELLADCR